MGIDTQILVRPPGDDPLADHPLLGGYRVVEGRHGTAVYGPIQISHLEGLQRTWEAAGYTIWDLGVASALGAAIPPGPGCRVLLWSRHGGDATVERAVRRAQGEDGGRTVGEQPEAAD